MSALPTVSSARLILRVLARVGMGIRRPRALAELLGLEVPVVQAILDSAEWLGLVVHEGDVVLTPAGLGCVYARDRRGAWAAAVRAHPRLVPLLEGGEVLSMERVMEVVRKAEPSADAAQARHRARTLARLVEPVLRYHAPATRSRQLGLDFSASLVPRKPSLDLRGGADDSLDVHTYVLRLLLDHGELSPGRLRGALDACGGASCGLGGYLATAVERGDALRVGDTLVVTGGAVDRRAIAESPVTFALSHRAFRSWLEPFLGGTAGVHNRFWPWLARLLPEPLPRVLDAAARAQVAAGIDRLLFGRPIRSIPLAGDPGAPHAPANEPFLRSAARRHLVISVASDLSLLSVGLSATNKLLRQTALEGSPVRPPTPLDRRLVVHGGLLHPGEAPPRSIPDGVSLRLRAVQNVPAFAILAALGSLERRGDVKLWARGGGLVIEGARRRLRPLASVVEELASARGWTFVRGPASASWDDLVTLAEQLGLLVRVDRRWTLDETFFHRLHVDAEHRETWEGLLPLADLLADRCSPPLEG